jgi:hypothetical protein
MRKVCSIVLFTYALTGCAFFQHHHPKQIIGATEVVEIVDANLSFKARVDTGAKTCSIHAEDINIDASEGNLEGKPISFRIVNKNGQSRQINTRVASAVMVKTAEGKEQRYTVPLTVKWHDSEKTILFTLNDRLTMAYPIVLGRNWLRGSFLVDVEKNSDD